MRLSRINDIGLRSRVRQYSILLEKVIDLGLSSMEDVFDKTKGMTVKFDDTLRDHYKFCADLTKDALELRLGLDSLESLSSEVVDR